MDVHSTEEHFKHRQDFWVCPCHHGSSALNSACQPWLCFFLEALKTKGNLFPEGFEAEFISVHKEFRGGCGEGSGEAMVLISHLGMSPWSQG